MAAWPNGVVDELNIWQHGLTVIINPMAVVDELNIWQHGLTVIINLWQHG